MVFFGLVILSISSFFGFREFRIITTGEEVNAVVSRIRENRGENGPTFTPEFTYRYNDQDGLFVSRFSTSSNNYVIGDPALLLVSNAGVSIKSLYGEIIGVGIGMLAGLLFSIIGIIWIYKDRKHFDEIARLKKIGKRVQARFLRQESSQITINHQEGVILFFQEEDSNRVFHTRPIYSEFSIKWLEEHVFDVYVDSKNSTKYFVDIEKHFGHPQKYN